MAIYHCHMQIINRASGRSSVAAAAYRSGEKLHNERDGLTHDFRKKSGIVYSQILLPQNAPAQFLEREKLWSAVEKSEKRIDAQTAREIEVALPKELNHSQQIELVRSFIGDNFTSQGMIADFSLHDKKDGNPHAHIMLTLRQVDENGFGKKQRAWNERKNAELWREAWAKSFNRALERQGIGERVDHRSYFRQGLDLIPTLHLGTHANALEKRGIPTDRGNHNRQAQKTRLAFLEREKAAILAQEKAKLSRLKNQYLEKALELSAKKAAAEKLRFQAEDYWNRARSITEISSFMDDTSQRICLIDQELESNALDHSRRLILERQQSQLERSLEEDRALLFSRFELLPGQVPERARQWRDYAASLEAGLEQGHELSFLEKLLDKLLQLIIDVFRELGKHLGPELSLHSLEPFAQGEPLSNEQQRYLQRAQAYLEYSLTQVITHEREPEGLTQEHSQGYSRGL